MTDIDDFIMGGGGVSATFLEIGTTHEGTIESIGRSQQTEFATHKPKFWDNGDPMMQAVVTLQTAERDPDVPDDDGVRKLYAAGGKQTNADGTAFSMLVAIREAVKKSGAKKPEVGGTLAVKYVENGKDVGKGQPPKLYRAKYTPPVAGPSADDLF